MIRREIQFADRQSQWLLISQVDHAHLSGELARQCLSRFGDGDPSLDEVRQELLQAIIHHDDGWAEWELAPRLDPQYGRPLSFMELPTAEALDVWSRSIAAAQECGQFAAWLVAGHFSALLCTVGHQAKEPVASDWLRETAKRRSEWFAHWHGCNPRVNTAEVAGEGLKWLQLFDILSLWPCSQYPVAGEVVSKTPEPFLNLDNWSLVREIHPKFELAGGEPCRIEFKPWPFPAETIVARVAANLVPARHYLRCEDMLAAQVPFTAQWLLAASSES